MGQRPMKANKQIKTESLQYISIGQRPMKASKQLKD